MNIWWIFSILWMVVIAFFAIVDAKRIWRTRKKNIFKINKYYTMR